jgi:hypothetical protein
MGGNRNREKGAKAELNGRTNMGFLDNVPEIEFFRLLIESYMLNVLGHWSRIKNLNLGLSLKLTSDLRQVINIPYILIPPWYYLSMTECLQNSLES